LRTSTSRRLAASVTSVALIGMLPAFPAPSRSHVQIAPTLAAGGAWLNRFNAWRSSSGLALLSENTTWSAGDYNHALYMVKNDEVAHQEISTHPYYTPEGDTAARNSNIYVSSSTSTVDESAIDWWMAAPFHAMGMMDPRLTSTGFGSYREVKSGWQMGAAVDVIRGNSFTGGQYPVYFPGNGSTEPLRTFGGNETPDPLQACPGYVAPTGLPVFVEIGGNVSTTVGPVHTITGNGVSLENCVIDSTNSTLGSSLRSRGGVILIPRQPLQDGVTYVVALTVNGLPYTWSFTVGPLSNSAPPPPAALVSLGGSVSLAPHASSWGSSRVDVFVQGVDYAMYQNTWNGSAWSGWSSQGGYLTSSPSAVSWSANRIDAFVRGADNQLYHKFWAGSGWSPWEPLGGVLTSGPVAASWSAGRLDVFVRGTDNGLWHKYWDGSRWKGWEGLGGVLTSDPGTVSWGPNRIDVVVRGSDNAIWIKTWGGGWSGWSSLGGGATSAPDITSCSSGHFDIFVRGLDNALYQKGFSGGSWTSWKSLGGNWTTGPAAVCRPGTGIIDLFAAGTDSAVWTQSVSGT